MTMAGLAVGREVYFAAGGCAHQTPVLLAIVKRLAIGDTGHDVVI